MKYQFEWHETYFRYLRLNRDIMNVFQELINVYCIVYKFSELLCHS